MVEPHLLYGHILAQTRQNVELLMAYKQISEADGEAILTRLTLNAERRPDESSVVALTQQTERLSMSPAPTKVEARAIWGWSSEDPNDLAFAAGEIIEVMTETNADWWTGRNRSGKQGLFPSNYVEKLPPRSVSPMFVPAPRKAVTGMQRSAEERYSSPALPHPPPQAPPQTQYPPLAGYCPPPPGPPPGPGYSPYVAGPPTPQPVGQQAKKNKFGGLMAQSAASGAGFGAGAAIGSGIVNSIF